MSAIAIPEIKMHERGKGAGGTQRGLADFGRNLFISVGVDTRFKKFQSMYRDDRVAFVYDCLPELRDTFAPYQEEILANFDMGHRRQAIRGPHGLGKTLIAAILVHHTLLTTEEDATVPTLASVERQLKRYLWPEVHKIAKLLNWRTIGRDPYGRDEMMNLSIRTNGGVSEAFSVASGDAAAIEGAHASRLFYIFDESKSVVDPMWDAAEGAFSTEGAATLGGSSDGGECYWLAISTPGAARGRFYEIHAKKEGLEDWLTRHVTIDEAVAAKRVDPKWVDKRARQWGTNSSIFKNRVLGEFAVDSAEGVIPLEWVEAAMQRWRDWDDEGRPGEGLGRRIIGVDTARFGVDKTVFADRVNDRVERLYSYARQPVTTTAGYLKPLAKQASEVHIEMDSGLGASVFDILNSEEDMFSKTMNLIDIYMGAGTTYMDRTHTFRFNNVRSAAWWHVRELLDPENGGEVALYPSDILLGDLAAPRYEIKYWHSDLTIFVEPKEKIAKADRLGRSTDEGDAVVLSFWDDAGGGGGVVF
jgi:hypothetical protein